MRRNGEKTFRYKKVVKKIREEHGMLELLHLVKMSEKMRKEVYLRTSQYDLQVIDYFYELILERKLLSA